MKPIRYALLAAAIASLPAVSLANTNVPGASDPWLAGMPDGTTASYADTAPGQSPVLFGEFALTAGSWLTFSATGSVDYCLGCTYPASTPDGVGTSMISHAPGAENGISDITAPLNSLVGVFLGTSVSSSAPGAFDFGTTGLGTDFSSLSPELQQVFFIGDGLTGTSGVQKFLVPTGATRLYLGTMDGWGWYNNTGSLDVSVNMAAAVPEPETYAMLMAGLGLIGAFRRRKTA